MSTSPPPVAPNRCPACNAPIKRLHRSRGQRVLSFVYPVFFYGCTQECGWTALRPAVRELDQRRRMVRLAILLAVLIVACVVGGRFIADVFV